MACFEDQRKFEEELLTIHEFAKNNRKIEDDIWTASFMNLLGLRHSNDSERK